MRSPARIELWLVDLEACGASLEALESATPRLADDDRARAEALTDARERRHRLIAYIALRVLLERVAGPDVRGKPLLRAPGGKPALAGGGAEYSLSHSDGWALVGVSGDGGALGVDLERTRRIKASPRARTEICAIGAGLGGRPRLARQGDRAFLQAWSRLEAFTKAYGKGLSRTLTDLGQRGQGQHLSPARLETAARRLVRKTGLSVRDLRLPQGLHGALAAPRGSRSENLRAFPGDPAAIARLLEPPPAAAAAPG